MNDAVTGAVPPPTAAQTEAAKIEGFVNEALPFGAAFGPIGTGVAAGVTAAEGVANTVLAESPHQTALTDLVNAAAAAAPVVAAAGANGTAPAAAAQKASGILALIAELGSLLKGIL